MYHTIFSINHPRLVYIKHSFESLFSSSYWDETVIYLFISIATYTLDKQIAWDKVCC